MTFSTGTPFRGKVLAEGGDDLGGDGNDCLIFQQNRDAFAEFDDKPGSERLQEFDFGEAGISRVRRGAL